MLRLLELRRVVDVSDDFSILSIVGQNTIGRLSFSPTGNAPMGGLPIVDLNDITQNGKETFKRLLGEYGVEQGVSGVQEKVLSNVDGGKGERWKLSASLPRTIASESFIIKSFDPEMYPALAENEYWTTRAAQLSGIDAVQVHLSDDFLALAVKRFDLLTTHPDHRFCVDEMCSLMGFSNDRKYLSSYGEVTDCLYRFSKSLSQDRFELFAQLVFMVATKNGDAHLKNFAILSSNTRDARLAPAYDLVSTELYADKSIGEFENPALALSYDNWTKKWWSIDDLACFAESYLELSSSEAREIIKQVEKGLKLTMYEMGNAPKSDDFKQFVMPKMLDQWSNPFSLIENRKNTFSPKK